MIVSAETTIKEFVIQLERELITQKQHDELKKMFPEVKGRCPVCYIERIILDNIHRVKSYYVY